MNKKKRIVLSGYYGFNNLGDEAILSYLVNFLKSNDIEPIVLSANPLQTSQTYSVESVKRSNFKEVTKAIQSSDGLISGGGSLLQDKTSKRSVIYYLSIMTIAHLNRKPLYFYGQGVGPINANDLKFFTRKVLNKTRILSVRDKESKVFLDKIGVKQNIELIHDPVLFHERIDTLSDSSFFSEEERIFLEKGPVYISIRPTDNDERISSAFQSYMKYLDEKNIPIISFPFHPAQDTFITKELLSKYKNTLFIERPLSIEQATYILGKSRLVVGLRLHSLILAASQGTPFIGVSYDPKIDSFMNQFHLSPIGDVHTLTADSLIKQTNDILFDAKVAQTVNKHMQSMESTNQIFNQKIIKIIKG